MLVLLSLLAAIGFAQDCTQGISDDDNTSQKRRQCKKLAGCKWKSAYEDNGQQIPGSCSATDACSALSHNACKRRNRCYINWAAPGRPCQDYDPDAEYPCAELSGKRNQDKCDKQPKCIRGSGDRANKVCLTIPDNVQELPCETFSNKPNKYLCISVEKCRWIHSGANAKQCVLKKKPEEKRCDTVNAEAECNNQPNGCIWQNNRCNEMNCNQINDRVKCNASDKGCTWSQGMNAKDYDIKKNKRDQKDALKNTLGNREGFCQPGVKSCDEIITESHCLLANLKHGLSGCYWNPEAKEMGRPRCSTREPCAAHTNKGRVDCLANRNMFNDNCVYQKSGDFDRCMEFACDDAALDTKNKCNTVGCHWHRNKDKRDPNSQGFCGILDYSKGRRL